MSDPTDWGRGGSEGFLRDANNEQTAVLPANGIFTGQWTRVDHLASFLLLYGTNVSFKLLIQWSKDGVNLDTDPFATTSPQVRFRLGLYSVISPQSTFFRPFYRMKITNGPLPQLFVVSDALLLRTQFTGYDIDVDGPIPVLGLARLGLNLSWGRTPTDWQPMQLTALKNQKVALVENLLGTLPVAPVGSSYVHRNTPGTAVIKSGPGTLRSVIRNGYGSSSTLILYDGLTAVAPVIASLGFSVAGSAFVPSQLNYDLNFTTGLTVVQTGIADFTVIYV